MSLYFLDSNIIMYTLGGHHALTTPCVRVLEKIRSAKILVCTNTEIFQEILYRYYSIDKKALAHQACDILKDIANPIFPITHEDIIKDDVSPEAVCNPCQRRRPCSHHVESRHPPYPQHRYPF